MFVSTIKVDGIFFWALHKKQLHTKWYNSPEYRDQNSKYLPKPVKRFNVCE